MKNEDVAVDDQVAHEEKTDVAVAAGLDDAKTEKEGGEKTIRPPAQQKRRIPAVVINMQIVMLGKKNQVLDILKLYDKEHASFDHVSYASVMVQLAQNKNTFCDDRNYRD